MQLYKQYTVKGETMTEDDWQQILGNVFEASPDFRAFMETHAKDLNDKEYKTCVLSRAGFRPVTISHMLGVKPSYISKIRSEMLKTLFHIEGRGREFDDAISSIG